MTCSIGLKIQIKKLQPKQLEEARGKYVVAEFLPFQDVDDITVEAIPGYWLGECATPFIIPLPKNIIHTYMFAYIPNDSSHRARKAKLENCLPDTAKWIKWPLRFVLKTIFGKLVSLLKPWMFSFSAVDICRHLPRCSKGGGQC